MGTTIDTGQEGEQIAIDYLKSKGYAVIQQNWRYGKYEIDLIIQKDNEICFVEIKMRGSKYLIEPILSVSAQQQQRIIASAHQYIQLHELDHTIRFDVVGIVKLKGSLQINHIKEAFYPTLDQVK